jgi:4-amino-4-deoxy-L-arabinose transferase-like glycosyltransferase
MRGAGVTIPVSRASRLELGLLALLLVALVPRLILQLGAPAFLTPDSQGYVEPALGQYNGDSLGNRFKRPVGYPYFVSAIFSLAGPRLAVVALVQHLLGLGAVGLAYLLGRFVAGRWVGLAAGLLLALSGPQLSYEHLLLSEGLFIPLLLLLALVLIGQLRSPSWTLVLLAGLLSGLLSLVKPVGQSLLLPAALVALAPPASLARRGQRLALLLAAFGLVVLPWMVRNQQRYGQLSVGGTLGQSLAAYTMKFSRGQFQFDGPELPRDPDPVRRAARRLMQSGMQEGANDAQLFYQLRSQLNLSETEADRLLLQLSVEAIARRPLVFLANLPPFFAQFFQRDIESFDQLWDSQRHWLDDPELAGLVVRPSVQQDANRGLVAATLDLYRPHRLNLLLPLLALLGLAALWRTPGRRPALVLLGLAGYLLLVHVVLNGPLPRYRYAVEPLLNVLVAAALGWGLGWAWRRLGRRYLLSRSARLSRT